MVETFVWKRSLAIYLALPAAIGKHDFAKMYAPVCLAASRPAGRDTLPEGGARLGHLSRLEAEDDVGKGDAARGREVERALEVGVRTHGGRVRRQMAQHPEEQVRAAPSHGWRTCPAG